MFRSARAVSYLRRGLTLLAGAVLVAACSGSPGPVVGVSGTWVSTAHATPLASPGVVFASPFPAYRSTPSSSPVASPGAAIGSPFVATPQPDNRVSATLAKGVGPDGQAVDQTTSFAPDVEKIYLVFKTRGLPPNSHLQAIWIADDVDAPVPKGYEVTRATITVQGDQAGNFALSRPNPGFPAGQYHVDLYLEGTKTGSYPFSVK